MFVVMVASECAPVAKVGGLADVVYGLSRELEIRGNAVEIILPKYDCMRYDLIWDLQISFQNLLVPWYNDDIPCTVWFGHMQGRKCFFIEPHSVDNFFNRGSYYGSQDEHIRFAFFSKAAMEFLYQSGKRPDVIHTHDWQTALVPVLLYELYQHRGMQNQRVCHTIHNFKHQGISDIDILRATGLNRPDYFLQPNRLQDNFNHQALNFTKGAITYANFVTTVSPTHAQEVLSSDQSYGLGSTLSWFSQKFGGVLNGLDYDMWNPEADPHLCYPYNVHELHGKYANKQALRGRLMLRDAFKPLIAYVGRLDMQKGIHLIRHAIFYALEQSAQFVLLGSSPEEGISKEFWHLKHMLNDNPDCHLEIGYDEDLAHLIYAGSDMMVVPSLYEPCGLTQMIALRYGSVPIVRAIGGLVDTVFDRDYSAKPTELRNGYVFHQADFTGIESAMSRCIGLWYHNPEDFRQLLRQGMAYDYSWNHPGGNYMNIYQYIRHK